MRVVNESKLSQNPAVLDRKCVCWIRNTVGEALKTYDSLREHLPKEKLTIFHARFAHFDRQPIEDDLLSRFGKNAGAKEGQGQLVIATQVIEQSLDVDFDLLVTDLAPIDLLIQRAGRQHRHARTIDGDVVATDGKDRRPEPRFLVYGPKYTTDPKETLHKDVSPGSAAVYSDTRVIYRTAKALSERTHLVIPQNSRVLVEDVYQGLDDAFSKQEDIPDAIEKVSNPPWRKDRRYSFDSLGRQRNRALFAKGGQYF